MRGFARAKTDLPQKQKSSGEIFIIRARRCKRCGGLLTSEQSLEDGYGHVCKMKTHATGEVMKIAEDQLNLLDYIKQI